MHPFGEKILNGARALEITSLDSFVNGYAFLVLLGAGFYLLCFSLVMNIKKNISLKEKNEFKTGGKAKFYCEPENKADFIYALSFAKEKKLKIDFLGDGANVLVSDEGYDGLIIKPILKNREKTYF